MSRFTYSFNVKDDEGNQKKVRSPITKFDIKIKGIYKQISTKLNDKSIVELVCESCDADGKTTAKKILEIRLDDLNKAFTKYIEPLAVDGLHCKRPANFNSNKLNDLFVGFLYKEIEHFKNGGRDYYHIKNTILKGIDKEYITKIDDDYYLVDSRDVYSLKTFTKSKDIKNINPDQHKKTLINSTKEFKQKIPEEIINEINEVMGANAFNPALLYLCSLPFKEILWQEYDKKFPHLTIMGETGAGKSTILEKICVPFLGKDENFIKTSNDTTSAAFRNIATSSNGALIFDEYTNTKSGNSNLERLDNIIKNSYDKSVTSISSRTESGVNEEFKLTGSFIIGGESMISEDAIINRSVPITCYQKKSNNNYFTHNPNGIKPYEYLKYLRNLHIRIIYKVFNLKNKGKLDMENWFVEAKKELNIIIKNSSKNNNIFKIEKRQLLSLTILMMTRNFLSKYFKIHLLFRPTWEEFLENQNGAKTTTERILESIIEHRSHRDLMPYIKNYDGEFRIRLSGALSSIKKVDNTIPRDMTKNQFTKEIRNKSYWKNSKYAKMGKDWYGKEIGSQFVDIIDIHKYSNELNIDDNFDHEEPEQKISEKDW